MATIYITHKSITDDNVIETIEYTTKKSTGRVFILNGSGGVGKDTFAKFLGDILPVRHISSISKIKEVARRAGWTGGKEEKDRKFLSDLKLLCTSYNDLPFKTIEEEVKLIREYEDPDTVILIDIREPEEIERAKKAFNAKTILIKRDKVPRITSNMADANVFKYNYDYIIDNRGTLMDFKDTVDRFAMKVFMEEEE